jgi:hypothetical protein
MPSEILVTVAEVAAAFVGFSMVVGLLSPGSPDSQQRFNAIRDVAEISLITVGGSLVPLAAELFAISEPKLWRACSLGLSVVWLAGCSSSVSRYRKVGVSLLRNDPAWNSPVAVLILAGNTALWWSVVSPAGATAGRYVLSLLALLAVAGVLFVNATFRSRREPSDGFASPSAPAAQQGAAADEPQRVPIDR